MMPGTVIEIIGYCGVASFIISYLQKSRKNIVFFSFLARIFFITHYLFKGKAGLSGALQNGSGGAAAALAGLKGKKPYDSVFVPILIVVLTLGLGAASYKPETGIITLLPVAAMLIQNPALWFKKQRNIRLMTLAGIPIWFVYNFSMGSIPAMTSDTLSGSILIFAIVKYDILPYIRAKKSNKQDHVK